MSSYTATLMGRTPPESAFPTNSKRLRNLPAEADFAPFARLLAAAMISCNQLMPKELVLSSHSGALSASKDRLFPISVKEGSS